MRKSFWVSEGGNSSISLVVGVKWVIVCPSFFSEFLFKAFYWVRIISQSWYNLRFTHNYIIFIILLFRMKFVKRKILLNEPRVRNETLPRLYWTDSQRASSEQIFFSVWDTDFVKDYSILYFLFSGWKKIIFRMHNKIFLISHIEWSSLLNNPFMTNLLPWNEKQRLRSRIFKVKIFLRYLNLKFYDLNIGYWYKKPFVFIYIA